MKPKVVIVVLAVLSVCLAIALLAVKKHSEEQRAADQTSIADFSNQVVNASLKINDLNQVNLALTNDLQVSRQESSDLSNKLDSTAASLLASKSDLADAQNQIAGLNSHLADLEQQNKALEQQSQELSNNIVAMDKEIAATKEKLSRATSANDFLQQELQRQMAQRAELEHKFNDLDELHQQVKKIKAEEFATRRLLLMENDHTGQKGAELLLHPNPTVPGAVQNPLPANGLNVEIGSDGSVRVIPPIAPPPPATDSSRQ